MQQSAFDNLKKRFANTETLGHFYKTSLTTVIADGSPVDLGAVLAQYQGGEASIYASRSRVWVLSNKKGSTRNRAGFLMFLCIPLWFRVLVSD